jgi:hypothetical protein
MMGIDISVSGIYSTNIAFDDIIILVFCANIKLRALLNLCIKIGVMRVVNTAKSIVRGVGTILLNQAIIFK